MPDLSLNELNILRDLMASLAPNLALALSEQVNRDLALENPEVVAVPIQDLLFSTEEVVQTVFSLSPPYGVETVFFFSFDIGHIFVDLIEGGEGTAPPDTLTEKQTEKLNAAMAGVARGFAVALANLAGVSIEMESNSVSIGTISLPPIFAMDGIAIQVTYSLNIPDLPVSKFTFLITPDMARLLAPPAEEESDGFADVGNHIIGEDDLAAMLSGLSEESMLDAPGVTPNAAPAAPFPGFAAAPAPDFMPRGLELIMDIPLEVTVELGRVRMLIKDVLELASGSIIELDRVAGEPVDLLVNGRLIAKGEVVVIEDNFGIRITEIISPTERIAGLGKGR